MKAHARKIAALVAGVLLTFALIEGGLRVVGTVFRWVQDYRNQQAIEEGGDFVILCIGESTTAHGANGDLATAYPTQLQEILNHRVGGERFTVVNRGLPYTDSSVALKELEANLEHYKPHVVAAMMGANDGRTGAIPYEEMPVAERTGLPYSLKTYQLLALLAHQVRRRGESPGQTAPIRPLIRPSSALEARLILLQNSVELVDLAGRTCPAGIPPADGDPEITAAELVEAETAARESLRAYPLVITTHLRLALIHLLMGRNGEALADAERALQLEPGNEDSRVVHAILLWCDGRFPEAGEASRELLASGTTKPAVYVTLAESLVSQGRPAEAEGVFAEALRNAPETFELHDSFFLYALTRFCERHQLFDQEERLLLLALELFPGLKVLPARLQSFYEHVGRTDKAAEWRRKAAEARRADANPMTRENYARLKRILDENGVRLVAVQYPGRPLADLEAVIDDPDGVVFVDNEADFRQALEESSYDALFGDHCYGDFGHATRKGNRILAENVADAIVTLLPPKLRAEISP
jgi:tetratricopeptide (TPR) repeat protein